MSKEEKEVKKLADTHTINDGPVQAIVTAARSGKLERVKLLIKYGADVNAKDKTSYGTTALIEATREGHFNVIKALAEEPTTNINLPDDEGTTALMHAALEGKPEVLTFLLDKSADTQLEDQGGNTALDLARETEDEECVALLETAMGLSPLTEEEKVQLLVKKKTIDAQDEDGWTPLVRAVLDLNMERVKLLIQYKANLNIQDFDDGNTALILATERNLDDFPKVLIEAKADVNIQSKIGMSALMASISSSQDDVARLLILDYGADVHQITENGDSALSMASCGHPGLVQLLIDKKAPVNIENKQKETPLFCAASQGYDLIASKLIKAGADVNIQNEDGSTPLMMAVTNGHLEVMELLIAAKANAQLKDEVTS